MSAGRGSFTNTILGNRLIQALEVLAVLVWLTACSLLGLAIARHADPAGLLLAGGVGLAGGALYKAGRLARRAQKAAPQPTSSATMSAAAESITTTSNVE